MKRAASKLAKKQTRTAKDGRRIKGSVADQKKSRADAVKSSGRIKGLVADQKKSRADAVKSSGRIKGLVAAQKKSRSDAVQSADLLARMNAQQELLELRNEQLSESNASLELSRHRYADLYNLSPVGYLTLDGKGCIREINQTASQMLGLSTSHLLGKPLLPHIIKQDRKVWLQHLWESRRSTGKIITTLQLQSKDGAVRKVQFATSRQEATGPHAKWCRTAMLDTTEKSDAQSALSASEAKFRLLAENMGEVFWFMELDPQRVTYVNPAFEQIWGVSAVELYADNGVWMRAIHPDDLAAVHTAFHSWIIGASATFRVEYRILNREGQIRWIADRGIVIGRKHGLPRQLSGIARDITERKRAEEKLKGVLEAAPDAMVIVDRFGIIEMVNAQAMRLFGYERSEMVDQVVELLVPESLRDRHAQHLQAFIAAPRHGILRADMELHGRRKDGSEFPTEITLSPLHTDAGVLVISAIRDITERKRNEEELRLRNAELRATNDELERFNRAMVDRELRMIELKQEINALLQQTGQPPRYRVDFASPSLSPRNS
jgi:PAS domain S-box-containing protein